MQPDNKYIFIPNGIELVPELLKDLFITPRQKAIAWSKITQQTPNMKVGYPGQHLVSLVTGIPGERTGARGNDLIDGSEIKSCSRIDQADKCNNCQNNVLRIEAQCSICGSVNIARNNDSKWLFTIRSENDLKVLTEDVKRIVLVLGDYPNFVNGLYGDIRFEIFEIWTNSPRCKRFNELMVNYYQNIYGVHKANNINKTPAPKNFWPDSYQFYLCNPIKIFSVMIKDSINNPQIQIEHYVPPYANRANLPSMDMPISKLNYKEILYLANTVPIEILRTNLLTLDQSIYNDPLMILKSCASINEQTKAYLPLREDKTFVIPDYSRRSF